MNLCSQKSRMPLAGLVYISCDIPLLLIRSHCRPPVRLVYVCLNVSLYHSTNIFNDRLIKQ